MSPDLFQQEFDRLAHLSYEKKRIGEKSVKGIPWFATLINLKEMVPILSEAAKESRLRTLMACRVQFPDRELSEIRELINFCLDPNRPLVLDSYL